MSKLLALDLDGTLFWPKQHRRLIPKKNVEFLRKWIDLGNKVVLVSSRGYDFTSKAALEIDRPVDHINYIGGQIRANDKLIRDVCIEKTELGAILTEIREHNDILAFTATTDEYPLLIRNNQELGKFLLGFYRIWYFFQGKYREKYSCDNKIFDSAIENSKTYLVRVMFGIKKKNVQIAKELNKVLREKYPQIECSWTDLIIEIGAEGCSKSASLNYYVQQTGYDKDDVYVVGDSGNDITMFTQFYEHSYCMAHSYSSVKKYAKNIISRVHNLDRLVLEGEKL